MRLDLFAIGWQPVIATASFAGLCAAAHAWKGPTAWLSLTMQLWLAYAVVWWTRRALARRVPSTAPGVTLAVLGAAAAIGALASLPLAHDFRPERLASPLWAAQRGALPLAFACALTLPGLLWEWRARRRHRQQLVAAERSAAMSALARQVTLAELKTLQAQVEPHFLYNTLASLQYLVRHDPALAEQMLERLHGYLRMALPSMRAAESTLGQEFALAEAYLAIMRMRLGRRLDVVVDLPDDLGSRAFPPMMLATLVENAVKHGIEPKRGGGAVTLSARLLEPQRLEVCVTDTGVGLGGSPAHGSGVGLANLRDRLASLFGDPARLEIGAAPDGGVRAAIVLPVAEPGSTPVHDARQGFLARAADPSPMSAPS